MCSFDKNQPTNQPMQISVLHFERFETERFREHTDIYIDKLFNVKFDVYNTRDQVSVSPY